MDLEGKISVDPRIMLGKPVIRGTRITVELILERLQSGETVEQIATSLKNIEVEDVYAAIDYAIDSLRREKVFITREHRQGSARL
ncbi:MAG: DUF433 domain-containing protein [Candidatus Aminicenantes bacterium]|nr:DUF433 domain-containing protein [Candidatus Aminicenantes bacterium]